MPFCKCHNETGHNPPGKAIVIKGNIYEYHIDEVGDYLLVGLFRQGQTEDTIKYTMQLSKDTFDMYMTDLITEHREDKLNEILETNEVK